MSHCHDEHHDHSHGGHDEHDHSDDITPALQHSLYSHINFDDVTALNESQIGSARSVAKKTWAERLDAEPEVVSDADEQLLVNIPYVFYPFYRLAPAVITSLWRPQNPSHRD